MYGSTFVRTESGMAASAAVVFASYTLSSDACYIQGACNGVMNVAKLSSPRE